MLCTDFTSAELTMAADGNVNTAFPDSPLYFLSCYISTLSHGISTNKFALAHENLPLTAQLPRAFPRSNLIPATLTLFVCNKAVFPSPAVEAPCGALVIQ
jgi:hypothetical protein